jgi:aldose 1-epimerase
VLDRRNSAPDALAPAARVSPGLRTLDIHHRAGVAVLFREFPDGSITGKGGHVYKFRYGLALETQHFPDSPNHSNFPSTILRPGQQYHSRTVFHFGVVN